MGNRVSGFSAIAALASLGLAPCFAFSQDAVGTADVDTSMADYRQTQVDVFDALSTDPSPRRQVLAGDIYIPDKDEVPSALRPKGEDVVARAAQLAGGDAFVQWKAASSGHYTSSACGPTTWPENEVGNLLGLEPDNAAAWAFAAALAQAKNDQPGVEDALARLGSASRADDHGADLLAEWTAFYSAHPALATAQGPATTGSSPASRALLAALRHLDDGGRSATSSLVAACTPDPASDTVWQRVGRCVDAGTLLATKGNSLAVRQQGLALLTAAGDHSDDSAERQRQLDWLTANSANPWQNFRAIDEDPATVAADWRRARSDIVATEHRLRRLGLPLQAPPGWRKVDATDAGDSAGASTLAAYQAYFAAAVQALQSSTDARQQAVGARAAEVFGAYVREASVPAASPTSHAPGVGIADIADAHPADVIVQWLAATDAGVAPRDAAAKKLATAALQTLEPDNAAAWAFALDGSAEHDADTIARMAQTAHFDDHLLDIVEVAAAGFRAVPIAPELLALPAVQEGTAAVPANTFADTIAWSMATTSAFLPFKQLLDACSVPERAADCTTIGRLMVHKSTTVLSTFMGGAVLRKAASISADDAARLHRVDWWQEQVPADPGAFMADALATKSEVEAGRLAATRAGKAEPPAGWQSAREKAAAAKATPAAK